MSTYEILHRKKGLRSVIECETSSSIQADVDISRKGFEL